MATVALPRLATSARAAVRASIWRSRPAAMTAVLPSGCSTPLMASVPASITHTCSWSAVWSGPAWPARISTVQTARSAVPSDGAASVHMTAFGVSKVW